MGRLDDAINEQFLTWELLGRGVLPAMEAPVCPEPPFREFRGYRVPTPEVPDDGRRHTALSSLLDTTRRTPNIVSEDDEDNELRWDWLERGTLVELPALIPSGFSPNRGQFGSFLMGVTECIEPLAAEFIGTSNQSIFQFVAGTSDAEYLGGQLETSFPEVSFLPESERLVDAWKSSDGGEAVIIEFSLDREFLRPLRTGGSDLYVPLSGVFSGLKEFECVLLQVLFEPVRSPWALNAFDTIIDETGSPIFNNSADLIKSAQSKFSQPLYGVVVRLAARTPDLDRTVSIVERMAGCLGSIGSPAGNALTVFTDDDEYPLDDQIHDLLHRQSCRFGMLLNLDELQELVHLPTAEIQSPTFLRAEGHTKAAPKIVVENSGLRLGVNCHRGLEVEVGLTPDQRTRHMHVIGASGMGKSTLLLNCIVQDMHSGQGLAVLDPHGDLIEQALRYVPKSRIEDVIILDPGDEDFPVGFNVLSAQSNQEKTLLASDLCSVFQRLATSWGDQMTAVLSNAILAILESSRGGSIADLRRFLVEKSFRSEFLTTVDDPEVVYFWEKEFTMLTGRGQNPQGSIVTRLNNFLRPKPIRYMVAQRENRLDFAQIMDERKILFVKLSHGIIGKENASLLGALVVAKIHQLTLGRQARSQSERSHFWLYMDEFQNFLTDSMASLLSGARKYNLGLILAHQDFWQLEGKDRDVASAVIANPYTRICFRLGDRDARKLGDGFSDFSASNLQSLSIGQAVCRMERADFDFNLATSDQPELSGDCVADEHEAVILRSREIYASPRSEVENQIALNRPLVTADSDEKTQEKEVKTTVSSTDPNEPHYEPNVPKESLPGRGGPEHKSLQQFVKRLAEGFGFQSIIEKPVLDGRGFIDVALERGDLRIAVEISVSTPIDKEVQNLRKCFDAGFDSTLLLSSEISRLHQIEKAATESLDLEELKRISFCQPVEFAEVLQKTLSPDSVSQEKFHKGLKVKATFNDGGSEHEVQLRSIRRVIRSVSRKLKTRPAID